MEIDKTDHVITKVSHDSYLALEGPLVLKDPQVYNRLVGH